MLTGKNLSRWFVKHYSKCRIRVLLPYDCYSRNLHRIKEYLQWQKWILWKLYTIDILYQYISPASNYYLKNQISTYAMLGLPIICEEKIHCHLYWFSLTSIHMFICVHKPLLWWKYLLLPSSLWGLKTIYSSMLTKLIVAIIS